MLAWPRASPQHLILHRKWQTRKGASASRYLGSLPHNFNGLIWHDSFVHLQNHSNLLNEEVFKITHGHVNCSIDCTYLGKRRECLGRVKGFKVVSHGVLISISKFCLSVSSMSLPFIDEIFCFNNTLKVEEFQLRIARFLACSLDIDQ